LGSEAYHSTSRAASKGPTTGTALGIDVGATLAKVARRDGDDSLHFRLAPATALGELAQSVLEQQPRSVGLTGGGAAELARLIGFDTARVNEFAAWGAGAAALLRSGSLPPSDRYLLVSLGTGTSIMLVDGMSVTRVGGTALGGGTFVGLGRALTGAGDFAALTALAARGARRRVDLLVSDIYRPGEIALAGDLTASSFGRLGRLADGERTTPADLAHALVGMLGENVALLCAGFANANQVSRIVFAGSTLRGNDALIEILRQITAVLGREPAFLPDGEFAGALGALLLASSGP
jgi:type II pantothenate kinase